MPSATNPEPEPSFQGVTDDPPCPPRARGDGRWLAGVLLAGVAYLGYLQLVEPFFFLRDDNAAYHLPAYLHSFRALTEFGELAQLNLHQSNGAAHLAVGQTAVLYPPPYLAAAAAAGLGDLRWTMDLEVGAHLLAATAGMFLLVRHLGHGSFGAAAAALVFLTAPFVIFVGRGWVVMAHGAAFVVWGLLLFLRLLEKPGWHRAAALAVLNSFFFLAGYPQLLVEASLFQGCVFAGYLLFRPTWRAKARPALAHLSGAAVLTALLSAPLLLPMLAQARSSARGFDGVSESLFVKWSSDPLHALWAQVLAFRPEELFHCSSAIYYVGLPVLAGAAWGFWRGDRRIRVLAGVAALAFLSTTTLWGVLYGLPVISSFRWPIKHYLPFLVLLLPTAVPAFEHLRQRRPRTAVAALLAALVVPLALPLDPQARSAPSPIRLAHALEVYETDRLLAEGDANGRFATVRTLGSTAFAPQLLTHNFATLFGFRQVGGYEPLMSRSAVETQVATDFATFHVVPEQVGPEFFQRLGRWGVSDVLAPTDPRLRGSLPASGAARLAASNGGIDLYENLVARPIVEDLGTGEALETTQTANRIRFRTEGPGRAVRLALTPLPGWTWSLDGREAGRPDEHPDGGFVVGIPPGNHEVELRYRTPRLQAGMTLGAAGWLVVLASFLRRRRRESAP